MTRSQVLNVDELKARYSGEILLPSDRGYETARWNVRIDKTGRPTTSRRLPTG